MQPRKIIFEDHKGFCNYSVATAIQLFTMIRDLQQQSLPSQGALGTPDYFKQDSPLPCQM